MTHQTSSSWCRARTVPRSSWRTWETSLSMAAPLKDKLLVYLLILIGRIAEPKFHRASQALGQRLRSPNSKTPKIPMDPLSIPLAHAPSAGATSSSSTAPRPSPRPSASTPACSSWTPPGATRTSHCSRRVCARSISPTSRRRRAMRSRTLSAWSAGAEQRLMLLCGSCTRTHGSVWYVYCGISRCGVSTADLSTLRL